MFCDRKYFYDLVMVYYYENSLPRIFLKRSHQLKTKKMAVNLLKKNVILSRADELHTPSLTNPTNTLTPKMFLLKY